jgi:uncharacterized protein with von Willebrand factor type A (vWA) domain
MTQPAPGDALIARFADFGAALRAAGLGVGTGDLVTFTAAVAALNPGDILDLYWAGRTTLVTRHADEPTYHEVFCEFFLGVPAAGDPLAFTPQQRAAASAVLAMPETEPGRSEERPEDAATLGHQASDAATVKNKAFAACTPEELADLRRIARTLAIRPPVRHTRRHRRADGRGRSLDLRRTIRETMRTCGEPHRLFWRSRRDKPRPLTLILDVSGSMADYSRNLVQFAHAAGRSLSGSEVFCFGTRLTRITAQLRRRRIDEAIDDAARAVFDFDGGTRIGASLTQFTRGFGGRGVTRRSIVVICSDGLDRGDPAMLDAALARLRRQCHGLIWLTPHAGAANPSLAMRIVAPYADAIQGAGNLADLHRFARRLADL